MKISGFEELKEAWKGIQNTEPSEDEIQAKVKQVFKRCLDAVKANSSRLELPVGKIFLENYYKENGRDGLRQMLSKISLFVDADGYEFLIKLKLIKK